MASRPLWQTAVQHRASGLSLYAEGRFEQALAEFQRAVHAFRKFESFGNPFLTTLSNGLSGLADSLAQEGRCHEALGRPDKAATCYELSLMDLPAARASRERFREEVRMRLAACYEQMLPRSVPDNAGPPDPGGLTLDITRLFPFSLGDRAVPAARLFELAPERYPHLRGFYQAARDRDRARRTEPSGPDDVPPGAHSSFAFTGTILGALWLVYSIIALRALFQK